MAVRIEFLESVAGIQIQFESIAFHEMNATGCSPGEQVLALIQIQRDEVDAPFILAIAREIGTLAEPEPAAKSCRTWRSAEEWYFRNFLGGKVARHQQD